MQSIGNISASIVSIYIPTYLLLFTNIMITLLYVFEFYTLYATCQEALFA